MNGLYTIVEFDENDKWFVMAEKLIDDVKYSYLVRVNNEEDDFIDEYKVVRSYDADEGEYMVEVEDSELLQKIIPVLIPETDEYIKNPDKLRKILQDS